MAAPKKPTKKTTKATKKIKPEVDQDAVEASPISKIEENNVSLLIAQALNRHKQEFLLEKKEKYKEMDHLAHMAEEYLSCFALIGYSLQNEKVAIFNMPSSKDEAALVDLLRSTFIDIANNRP